jgi:hypothetical protein
MPTIEIGKKAYDLDCLSDDAKEQLRMVQFGDQEIARLNA